MAAERLYPFGPGTPFRINDVFTNRDDYLNAYHQRALLHCTRKLATSEIFDFQRPAHNIMSLIGQGGIGKSALLRNLAEQSVSGSISGLPKHRTVALIDFADRANHSFEANIFRIRASMGRLALTWPTFDFAFSLYWERKYPGEPLAAFVRRQSWICNVMGGANLGDQIATTVDNMAGGLGVAGFGYRIVSRITRITAHALRLRHLRRELPQFDQLMDEPDPDKMLRYLPSLLAYDLEANRKRHPSFVLCLLDTFEHVQALPPLEGGLEDMIANLVYLLPNVFFLLASREPLQWYDPVRSIGLRYGGAIRWPGLAGAGAQSDQFDMDGLEPLDADDYLRRRITDGDLPVIPEPIRERIISQAKGSPLYLELSATLYEEISNRGEQPTLESFGGPFAELAVRMMRGLSPEDRDILRAASLIEAFDINILKLALPNLSERRVDQLLIRFAYHDPTVWPEFRLHENLRRSIAASDELLPDGWTRGERRRHLEGIVEYLEETVLAPWDEERNVASRLRDEGQRIVASFLLILHAAAEYDLTPPRLGVVAYILRQLGYGQVLVSLPEYRGSKNSELGRLTAIARLCSHPSLDVAERFSEMKRAGGDLTEGTYAGYACLELGFVAWWIDNDQAENYLRSAYGRPSEINVSVGIGLAGTALRRSRFREFENQLPRGRKSKVDEIRTQDLLGHSYMHSGYFERAAEVFTTNLDRARSVGMPLFVSRSARHTALACMWFDPERTLMAVRDAWELNESLPVGDSTIGLAQCALAAGLAHAMKGDWQASNARLADARQRFEKLGVRFEMLPREPVELLVMAGEGRLEEAKAIGTRLAMAQRAGSPLGPPVWVALAALWLDSPDWFAFGSIDWIDGEAAARRRWLAPFERLVSR